MRFLNNTVCIDRKNRTMPVAGLYETGTMPYITQSSSLLLLLLTRSCQLLHLDLKFVSVNDAVTIRIHVIVDSLQLPLLGSQALYCGWGFVLGDVVRLGGVLEHLVAREDELPDERHQLVEQRDVHADRRVRRRGPKLRVRQWRDLRRRGRRASPPP